MRNSLLLVLAVLLGCGQQGPKETKTERKYPMEPDKLKKIQAQFEYDMAINGIDVTAHPVIVRVSDLDGTLLGECVDGTVVNLDESYDDFVFYHEMGHCMFGIINHSENPDDIMYGEYVVGKSKITPENLKRYVEQVKAGEAKIFFENCFLGSLLSSHR